MKNYMVKKDKDYYVIELIVIICYIIGFVLTCITMFIPFIFIIFIAYPISKKILLKNEKKFNISSSHKNKIKKEKEYGKFSKGTKGGINEDKQRT